MARLPMLARRAPDGTGLGDSCYQSGMPQGAFAEATVLALDGTSTKIASLWKDGPVVLVFLRHFG